MFMHNFCFLLYKVTNLTLYMYCSWKYSIVCYTCIPFIYVDVHLKTIFAVTLARVRRWRLLQDCLPVKFKDPKFMKLS